MDIIKICDFSHIINHQKISKYPYLRKTFVLSGVLTRTGLITPVKQNEKRAVHTVGAARPVSTARPVITGRPFSPKIAQTGGAIRPIYPRMDNVRPRGSYSPMKRSYYTKLAFRPKDLKQDVKTFEVQHMTTTRKRVVVNNGKVKMNTDLRKSRWVWRPKRNYVDHMSKDSGSFMLKKGNLEILLQDHAVVDSVCPSHMTGNKAYLSDYEDYNGGFVALWEDDPKDLDLKKIVPSREVIAKALDDATRQAFEEEKRNITSQKKATQATSFNKISTGRSSVSTDTMPYVITVAASTPNSLEDDSDAFSNDGIFNGAYDDKTVGVVDDFNNMDATINVSPIPTLKIHKDYPKDQILGDPKSAVQTRGKIQEASSA
ncbi:hypothetical protein Tco_0126631 [Tanacetum coccineum]